MCTHYPRVVVYLKLMKQQSYYIAVFGASESDNWEIVDFAACQNVSYRVSIGARFLTHVAT